MARSCPDPRCSYKANSAKAMERHQQKTRHGRERSARHQFRGHLSTKGKKKNKK